MWVIIKTLPYLMRLNLKSILLEGFAQLSIATCYILFGMVDYHYFTGAIWPASGFALAIILIKGWRYLTGIFLGSMVIALMLFHAPLEESIFIALGISLGHLVEVILGVSMIELHCELTSKTDGSSRFSKRFKLINLNAYLKLIWLGGAIACFFGASVSVFTLAQANLVAVDTYWETTLLWWMGDSLGVVLVAPLILVWQNILTVQLPKNWLEISLLITGTFVAGQIEFLGWLNTTLNFSPRSFMMFLPIVLVASRLEAKATTFVLNVIAVQAIIGAYRQVGCFSQEATNVFSVGHYWLYMITLSIVGMVITLYVNEIKYQKCYQQALIDNFPFVVWLKDTQSRFLTVNKALADRYGMPSPEKMMGYDDFAFSPASLAQHYQKDDLEILQSGNRKMLEEEIVNHDGSTAWFETYKSPVFDSNGKSLGTVGFARDISERKQREIQLQKFAEQESNARAEQSQFMAMLAHELKTPLSVIRMALGSKNLSEQMLFHANQAIDDIKNVVDRCLQLERLNDGALQIEFSSFELAKVLENVIQNSNVKQRFFVKKESSPVLNTDEYLVTIILQNLIENAVKYSKPESVIDVGIEYEGKKKQFGVSVWVRNLIGSAGSPDPEKVFEKYYRSKSAYHKTGSGLGLYLVKTMSQLLNGDVNYFSDSNHVTFKLWLPLQNNP
jgi:PAS domain S-box-containing protein